MEFRTVGLETRLEVVLRGSNPKNLRNTKSRRYRCRCLSHRGRPRGSAPIPSGYCNSAKRAISTTCLTGHCLPAVSLSRHRQTKETRPEDRGQTVRSTRANTKGSSPSKKTFTLSPTRTSPKQRSSRKLIRTQQIEYRAAGCRISTLPTGRPPKGKKTSRSHTVTDSLPRVTITDHVCGWSYF